MKTSRKFFSIALAVLLCLTALIPAVSAADTNTVYYIENPYKNIDWDSINQYKAALHTHTNASDGDPTLKQSLERHTQTGFDIVASTDHGTVNYSWVEPNPNKLIHGALSLVGKTEGDLIYLGTQGQFESGTSYTVSEANGTEYLNLSDGRTIMRVPYGIENNAVSVNAHVNGFFADYSDNTITNYEDAVKGVDAAGGLSVINHPGEYSKARYELHSADAYNEEVFSYKYLINKWCSLLEKFPSCLGFDVNSKGDGRTRFDRIVWDKVLTRFSKNGKNIYCICSSDAHQLNKIDTGFTYILMNDLTPDNMKKAMAAGEMIGGSHCIGNYEELCDIAAALKSFYGETELYTKINTTTLEMEKRVAEIESGERDADDDIGITYDVLDEQGFCTVENQPMITSVTVSESDGTITVDSENALIVRWISDGKLIATTKADEGTLSLADFDGEIGSYVRAEVFGEGGILYTEPFLIAREGVTTSADVVEKGYFNAGIFDFLFAVFHNWGEILGRVFANLFN